MQNAMPWIWEKNIKIRDDEHIWGKKSNCLQSSLIVHPMQKNYFPKMADAHAICAQFLEAYREEFAIRFVMQIGMKTLLCLKYLDSMFQNSSDK